MNNQLWSKILEYDLDSPASEYGFSTRLANENFWTKDFTQKAILEYKKFMYLAATSDFMVSPSEIVDTVWHQHLIFTHSYQEFGRLLGKQIQHIPSTHNKEDFQKFKQAKDRTTQLYETNFGSQPKGIWECVGMYESLNLKKANSKIRTLVIMGLLALVILIQPFYWLLEPIYVKIDNPDFVLGFIALTLCVFVFLEWYNRTRLKQIARFFDEESFIFNLSPFELIYLKDQKLSAVINGTVNELIDNETIKINSDNTIELGENDSAKSVEQRQAATILKEHGKTYYPTLLRILVSKPIFWNTAKCMDALKKYFTKSEVFGNLFSSNYIALSILLMLGLTRLFTGLMRDKPVAVIVIVLIILTIAVIIYLNRLTKLFVTKIIPTLYKEEILPTRDIENNWQWTYFLFGTSVLTTSFIPLVNYVDKNNASGSSCGTSCGSSCGSSCSSCGGCGGD